MAFVEDFTQFFNTDDFAIEAVFTHAGGSADTVKGIFDSEYFPVESDGAVAVSGSQPRFQCASADVSNAAYGDTLEVEGTDYIIVEIQPDGTGTTLLILEEDA